MMRVIIENQRNNRRKSKKLLVERKQKTTKLLSQSATPIRRCHITESLFRRTVCGGRKLTTVVDLIGCRGVTKQWVDVSPHASNGITGRISVSLILSL